MSDTIIDHRSRDRRELYYELVENDLSEIAMKVRHQLEMIAKLLGYQEEFAAYSEKQIYRLLAEYVASLTSASFRNK